MGDATKVLDVTSIAKGIYLRMYDVFEEPRAITYDSADL